MEEALGCQMRPKEVLVEDRCLQKGSGEEFPRLIIREGLEQQHRQAALGEEQYPQEASVEHQHQLEASVEHQLRRDNLKDSVASAIKAKKTTRVDLDPNKTQVVASWPKIIHPMDLETKAKVKASMARINLKISDKVRVSLRTRVQSKVVASFKTIQETNSRMIEVEEVVEANQIEAEEDMKEVEEETIEAEEALTEEEILEEDGLRISKNTNPEEETNQTEDSPRVQEVAIAKTRTIDLINNLLS